MQDKPTTFAVNVQKIFVDSEKLAKALLCLLERWQAIILMCYYLQLKDKQIVRNANGKPKTERANHVRVTEEERALIEEKMKQIPFTAYNTAGGNFAKVLGKKVFSLLNTWKT